MTDSKARERVEHTHIGGQAVLEGIMMRGKYNWAIAVRQPNGEIHVEEHDLKTAASKRPWLAKPVIRGVVTFYDTIVLAMQAFAISAEYAGMGEEEGEQQLTKREISFSMILGLALSIALFIVAPALVTGNTVVDELLLRPVATPPLGVGLEPHVELVVEEAGRVGAVVGPAVLRGDDRHLREGAQDAADLGRDLRRLLERGRASRPSRPSSRSSCSPTTSRSGAAATWISRATWRRVSR